MIDQLCAAVEVTFTQPDERSTILGLAHATAVFSAEEEAAVDELLRDYFVRGAEASGYHFLSCRADGRLLGFACWGPRSLTQGAFDLYWIVADPSCGREGVGSALLARLAAEIRARGGRLVMAETSSRPEYAAARAFYPRRGFVLEATIRDFYEPGDDLLLYVLRLA